MKFGIALLFMAFFFLGLGFALPALAGQKQVIFYPAYGYRQGEQWIIPIRLWVYENRQLAEGIITKIATSLAVTDAAEKKNFRTRIAYFLADDESAETVILAFDQDPHKKREFRLQSKTGLSPRTDMNGLIIGNITLSLQAAAELEQAQGSQHGWLSYHAVSPGQHGNGRVRLLAPSGLSIISDIDDTIKITEIPAGRKTILRNTFFRDFRAVPGIAACYQGFGDAAFHYVSGSPWQLYPPLADFMFDAANAFPAGTFHLRNARKNPLNPGTWEDLENLFSNAATFEQKISQITEIIERFPGRKFILIGDSGEKDPEVYRQIRASYPEAIQEIRIRDVVGAQEKNPARLQGMTVIAGQ
jgi:hypothetical protein